MTDKEIIEKAIQKAIDGGWKGEPLANGWGLTDYRKPVVDSDGAIWQYDGDGDWNEVNAQSFIFNHDFAKALFGEELHHETFIVPKELNKRFAGTKDLDVKPAWQYHLQQMVIAEDPIKYLGDNLD